MLSYFAVKEQSMEPWAREGDFVLVDRTSYLFFKPRVGHVVVAKHPENCDLFLLKRIVAEKKGLYWIEGNNASKSIDSRNFGWLRKEYIVGKVYIVGKPSTKPYFAARLRSLGLA